MATQTAPVKIAGFAAPWTTSGDVTARAYPVADSFAAAKAGFKRKRKSVMFHMLNTGEAGNEACVVCKAPLNAPARAFQRDMGNDTRVESPAGEKADKHSTWDYNPSTKTVSGGRHYLCSWSILLGRIAAIRQY